MLLQWTFRSLYNKALSAPVSPKVRQSVFVNDYDAQSTRLKWPVFHYQSLRNSSSSSKRWQTRQVNDKYARDARVKGLKSRAAFKLLEVHVE